MWERGLRRVGRVPPWLEVEKGRKRVWEMKCGVEKRGGSERTEGGGSLTRRAVEECRVRWEGD